MYVKYVLSMKLYYLISFVFHTGTLQKLYPSINSKDIITKMSRWFSGAPDRDGGKKERLMRKQNYA